MCIFFGVWLPGCRVGPSPDTLRRNVRAPRLGIQPGTVPRVAVRGAGGWRQSYWNLHNFHSRTQHTGREWRMRAPHSMWHSV